jgi:hypothetical protein
VAIQVSCPHCGAGYKLKDELAGRKANCKTCKKHFVITPDEDEVLEAMAGLAEQSGSMTEAVPGVMSEVSSPQPAQRPRWLLPAVGGGVGLTVVIVVMAFLFNRGGDDVTNMPASDPPTRVVDRGQPKPVAPPSPAAETPMSPAAETPPLPDTAPAVSSATNLRRELIRRPEIDTAALLAAPKITLKTREGTTAEINRLLVEAGVTGVTLPRLSQKADLAIDDMPYWQAMEAIGRPFGMVGMRQYARDKYIFTAKHEQRILVFDAPTSVSGGLHLQYAADRGAQKPDPDDIDTDADLEINFRLRKVPGMELVTLARELQLTAAEDEAGRSLMASMKNPPRHKASKNFDVSEIKAFIKKPQSGPMRVKRLAGMLAVEVPAEVIRARFENPLRPGNEWHAGDYNFKVQAFGKGQSGWPTLSLEVRRASNKPDVLEPGVFDHVNDMQIRLVDSEGKTIAEANNLGSRRGFVLVEISRHSLEPFPEPIFLVADVPVDVRKVSVPFEFRDLQLPPATAAEQP